MADEQNPHDAEQPQDASAEQPQEASAEQPREASEDAGAEQPQDVGEDASAEQPQEIELAQDAAVEPPESPEPPAALAEQREQAATAEPVAEVEEEPEDAQPEVREKPAVPGAHLEVDIVPEGADPLGRGEQYEDTYAVDPYASEDESEETREDGEDEAEEVLTQPIATAAIDLASGARYRATGKRKSAIARVTLRPGTGSYVVNGRTLEEHFPRLTLQRNIRQPLETVGYEDRMDVVARLHGGGISAQAGALRHGVSRALLEADPNLRGELKRRGFLTRDSRAKERKKAGLKKARKRPQFSKR
jgi:small subunit ribosomal protein S9